MIDRNPLCFEVNNFIPEILASAKNIMKHHGDQVFVFQ